MDPSAACGKGHISPHVHLMQYWARHTPLSGFLPKAPPRYLSMRLLKPSLGTSGGSFPYCPEFNRADPVIVDEIADSTEEARDLKRKRRLSESKEQPAVKENRTVALMKKAPKVIKMPQIHRW